MAKTRSAVPVVLVRFTFQTQNTIPKVRFLRYALLKSYEPFESYGSLFEMKLKLNAENVKFEYRDRGKLPGFEYAPFEYHFGTSE